MLFIEDYRGPLDQLLCLLDAEVVLTVRLEFLLEDLQLSPKHGDGCQGSLHVVVSLLKLIAHDAVIEPFKDILQSFLVRPRAGLRSLFCFLFLRLLLFLHLFL